MTIKEIEHIGIAVRDLESSLEHWAKAFGFKKGPIESLPHRGVKVAYLWPEAGPAIELVSPLSEDSPVKKFLEKRGEGLHHLCFRVKNLRELMAFFQREGISFLTEEPVSGAGGSQITFIHPQFFNGVLIEFKEKEEKPDLDKDTEEKEKI